MAALDDRISLAANWFAENPEASLSDCETALSISRGAARSGRLAYDRSEGRTTLRPRSPQKAHQRAATASREQSRAAFRQRIRGDEGEGERPLDGEEIGRLFTEIALSGSTDQAKLIAGRALAALQKAGGKAELGAGPPKGVGEITHRGRLVLAAMQGMAAVMEVPQAAGMAREVEGEGEIGGLVAASPESGVQIEAPQGDIPESSEVTRRSAPKALATKEKRARAGFVTLEDRAERERQQRLAARASSNTGGERANVKAEAKSHGTGEGQTLDGGVQGGEPALGFQARPQSDQSEAGDRHRLERAEEARQRRLRQAAEIGQGQALQLEGIVPWAPPGPRQKGERPGHRFEDLALTPAEDPFDVE